jgi:hypothetical protein
MRHEQLVRLSQAAVEFLAAGAGDHGDIARVDLSSTLIDGQFADAVDVQLSDGSGAIAIAGYASGFGVPVRFEDCRTNAETVWVYAVGTVAGERVKVWDAISRAQAHRLAVQWGQTPNLSAMDARVVLSTLADVGCGAA